MKPIPIRTLLLACLLLLLSACGGQKTPQEVTQAFWNAVSIDDAHGVIAYSTLSDTEDYDRFSREDWADANLSWGKVVIDKADAEIVTELSDPETSEKDKLTFSTYLVRQGEQWKVDYARTADDLRASAALEGLVGRVGAFGREISNQIEDASREFDANIKSMAEQFRAFSKSIQKDTSDRLERYGEELERQMDELAESIERALKEHRDDASEKDGRILREVVIDLNESSESLSSPNEEAIAHSNDTLVASHQRLDAVEGNVFDQYKSRWKEWQARFESKMEELLTDLSSGHEA